MAAGRIGTDAHRARLREHFDAHGWLLWDEAELKKRVSALANESYDNAVASVVSKLLVRERHTRPRSTTARDE